jgi:hypothetical protein
MNKKLIEMINSLRNDGIYVYYDGYIAKLKNGIHFKIENNGSYVIYQPLQWISTIRNKKEALNYLKLKAAN